MAAAPPHPPNHVCHVLYKPPNFKIKELLGSGSFSEVFRAEHRVTSEVLALKIFRQKLRTMEHYRSAANEVAYLELVVHPNIVELEIYEINKVFVYIGTEFAAFGNLRNYINEQRPVSESIIRCVMKQLFSALTYMHEMGMFHGDIKPENIVCSSVSAAGPILKLADFGLSEIKLKGDDDMVFKSGSYMYMAPEVYLKYPVDCSCDLWSAGVIMYSMMFSRNMYDIAGKDKEKQLGCLKRRVPINWQGTGAFSFDCVQIAKNLLSYDKHKRFIGEKLRTHPFVNIPAPKIPTPESLAETAQIDIRDAFEHSSAARYGQALVKGTKAILKLKILYNIIGDPVKQKFLRQKWAEYRSFTSCVERALVRPFEVETCCPVECSDNAFRIYLASTSRLLDGFDIGCEAEMFLKEGKKQKALAYFHDALQMLLPLMKTEPRSNRKEILGKRLKKWIEQVELLDSALKPILAPASTSAQACARL